MQNTNIVATYDYYTLDQARKIIAEENKLKAIRRANRRKQRRKLLLQVLVFKFLSLLSIIGAIAIVFVSSADGSAALACLIIGLTGLFVPYNIEITW